MREYLYLWIGKYRLLNDFGGDGYLIKNQGIVLSSKTIIDGKLEGNTITFSKKENSDIPQNFFSPDFIDIKAIIGQNGSGKSSILKLLFKIIGEGYEEGMDDIEEYIIFYKNSDGSIHYYKSSDCHKSTIASFAQEDFEKNTLFPHKSPRSIFYTAAVNDTYITNSSAIDCYDISTNALLMNDKENLYNDTLLVTDHFTSYVTMEMIRKIKFASLFYNDFVNNKSVKFRVPNAIRICPIKIDEKAIKKITDDPEKIENWKKIESSIESFNDYFRLAFLYNHIKGYPADLKKQGKCPSIIDNPKTILQIGLEETIKRYCKESWLSSEQHLALRIERMLKLLDIIKKEQDRALKEYKKIKPSLSSKDGVFFDFNDALHRKILKIFINCYQSSKITWLTPFLILKWRVQSSGEEAFIKFYSRFYDILKNYREELKPKDIHLFIDEADLYLHPEWQRCWMYEFIEVMGIILERLYPKKHPSIQMFIATHSPFMITDFPKDNLVLLKRPDGNKPVKIINDPAFSPFGSNLFDLLSDSFFLNNSIGLFSEKKIQSIIQEKKQSNADITNNELTFIKQNIGDPIMRSLIKNMVEKK